MDDLMNRVPQADDIPSEQTIPAFIGALLREGVEPELIEKAIIRVQCLRPGDHLTANVLHRAFVFEQARELELAKLVGIPGK